jgi:hypothetical protein
MCDAVIFKTSAPCSANAICIADVTDLLMPREVGASRVGSQINDVDVRRQRSHRHRQLHYRLRHSEAL